METQSTRLARVGLQTLVLLLAQSAGCGGGDPAPVDDLGVVTVCTAHSDCDDGAFCNGAEQCMPSSASADADGCVVGASPCLVNMSCDETTDACGASCTSPDMDGDGHDAITCGGDDCDDGDADRFPGNPETCDDGAGGQHDEDCDPSTFGTTDRDGDGEVSASCCNASTSGPVCGSDCDDTTLRRRSGQVEFCDSVDNDCDGTVDEETQDVPWYPDTDGDGFGDSATPTVSCTPVTGHSLASTDCNDGSAQEHPAQIDICDLTDNNCNTDVDELPICDVVQLIGPAGGTLTTTATGGGAITVQVPAGALSAATPLALGELHPRTLPSLQSGQSFVGRPVSLVPYDQDFSVTVNVSLPAAGSNLAVLRLDHEDDETWEVVNATFVGGRALFGTQTGGIFAVVTKTCTASTETCDSVDNDCDWLVDEEDVCGGNTLADRVEGWWIFCDQFDITAPTFSLIQSGCAAQPDTTLLQLAAGGEMAYSEAGDCFLEGGWSTPGGSTFEVRPCYGTANESVELASVYFAGLDDRYIVLVFGAGSDTEYEVYERLAGTPPASCEGTPPNLDECGPVLGEPCPTQWHVVDGACVQCPVGTTNAAGDDPSGADTVCDAGEPCLADWHVVDGVCVQCPFGTTNAAGDDPSAGDTACDVVTICDDAGAPIVYRLGSLNIPTPEQASQGATIGHNLDGTGAVCGVSDYAGGVDNSLIDLVAALPSLAQGDPIDIQGDVDAGLACAVSGPTCTRLDLMVHVSVGTDCVIVEIQDAEGTMLMSPVVGSLDGSGNFRADGGALLLPIPLRTSSGTIDWNLALSSVIITGTRSDTTLSNVVIGGALLQAAFETAMMDLLPLLGANIVFEDIEPILSNLYDVQDTGVCSALSAGFTAAGAI